MPRKLSRIDLHYRRFAAAAFAGALTPLALYAQQELPTSSKPPVSQAWIDVATHHSDIPGMAMMGGGMSGGMAGLFGGGKGGNTFGNTRMTMSPGKWLDVSVMTRNQPDLAEATQAIPPALGLDAALRLLAPPPEKYDPPGRDDEPLEPRYEKPKGRVLLYWGCGEAVRAGQPRVFDAANADLDALQKFFGRIRNSTTRGARSAPGNPAWPNRVDDRRVPEGASLIGEHQFTGSGIVENFRFTLGSGQDFMPAFRISQKNADGATQLQWASVSNARGYFLSAVGAGEKGDADMVIWTSSELPELGFALIDYQTNTAIDRWIKEKAVLPASATQCSVPRGIFGQGAMLRAIAYGSEAYFVHPPRPSNPKAAWEPQWQAKVRVKSTFMTMLGEAPARADAAASGRPQANEMPNPVNVLKGLFGR